MPDGLRSVVQHRCDTDRVTPDLRVVAGKREAVELVEDEPGKSLPDGV